MKKDILIEKIKTNFKKNKLMLLAFLVIWAITVIFTLNSYKDTLILKDLSAYADGTNDLFELSDLIGHSVSDMLPSVKKMVEAGLLSEV